MTPPEFAFRLFYVQGWMLGKNLLRILEKQHRIVVLLRQLLENMLLSELVQLL